MPNNAQQSISKTQNRYNFIDVLKIIAMFFVYTVHYSGMGRYGLYFFLLLVPMFFFASGFTAFTHENDDIILFIKTKLARIVWPYIMFTLVSLAVKVLVMQMPLSEIIDFLRRAMYGARNVVPVVALWFLPCLFVMSILYHLLTKLIKNKALLLLVCFAISVAVKLIREDPVWPWGIDMAARFIIYYALGDFFHACISKTPIKTYRKRTKAILLYTVFLCAFVSYFGFYYGLGYIPSLFGISSPPFIFLAAEQFLYILTGLYSLVALSMLLQNIPALYTAGKYTLIFCGVEQIIKTLLPLFFSAFGLTISDAGGAIMLMQAVGTMVAAYYLLVLPISKHMPWLTNFNKAVGILSSK